MSQAAAGQRKAPRGRQAALTAAAWRPRACSTPPSPSLRCIGATNAGEQPWRCGEQEIDTGGGGSVGALPAAPPAASPGLGQHHHAAAPRGLAASSAGRGGAEGRAGTGDLHGCHFPAIDRHVRAGRGRWAGRCLLSSWMGCARLASARPCVQHTALQPGAVTSLAAIHKREGMGQAAARPPLTPRRRRGRPLPQTHRVPSTPALAVHHGSDALI